MLYITQIIMTTTNFFLFSLFLNNKNNTFIFSFLLFVQRYSLVLSALVFLLTFMFSFLFLPLILFYVFLFYTRIINLALRDLNKYLQVNFYLIFLKKTKMDTSITSLLYKMWVVVKVIAFWMLQYKISPIFQYPLLKNQIG